MLEQHFFPGMDDDSPDNQNNDSGSGKLFALFICVVLIVFYLRLTMAADDCYTAATNHNVVGPLEPKEDINPTENKSDNG